MYDLQARADRSSEWPRCVAQPMRRMTEQSVEMQVTAVLSPPRMQAARWKLTYAALEGQLHFIKSQANGDDVRASLLGLGMRMVEQLFIPRMAVLCRVAAMQQLLEVGEVSGGLNNCKLRRTCCQMGRVSRTRLSAGSTLG